MKQDSQIALVSLDEARLSKKSLQQQQQQQQLGWLIALQDGYVDELDTRRESEMSERVTLSAGL